MTSVDAPREPSGSGEHPPARDDLEEIELSLLLEGVFRTYGFDFRQYAPASLRRRVWRRIYAEGLKTISALQEQLDLEPLELIPCLCGRVARRAAPLLCLHGATCTTKLSSG